MENKEGKNVRDFLVGLFAVVLSLVILFILIPRYIAMPASNDGLTPASYPKVCGFLLLIFGALQTGSVWIKNPKVPFIVTREIGRIWREGSQVRKNVLVSMGIAVLYYFLVLGTRKFFHISGFYVATPVCMLLLGRWLNWTKWHILILVTAITTVSIYLVFWRLLGIRIP